MKNLLITESEKNRILNMHKTVTSKFYLNEENGNKSNVYYNKCEGGQGLIEPESFVFLDKREKFIKFIRQPDPNFDNGNSKSIGKCLGFDQPMENTCYEVLIRDNKKIAYYGIDCDTKERW
jgi:hypothetical protein